MAAILMDCNKAAILYIHNYIMIFL